jgi:hypothetical protein
MLLGKFNGSYLSHRIGDDRKFDQNLSTSLFNEGIWMTPLSATLQRTNTENWKQIIPEKELRGHSPSFNIHMSVSDIYIPTMDLPILLAEICGPLLDIYKSLTDT